MEIADGTKKGDRWTAMKHELGNYEHEYEYEPQSLRLECEPRMRMHVIGLVDMHEVGCDDDVFIETVPRRVEDLPRLVHDVMNWAAAIIRPNE
jgi:hypothetical protein